MTLSKSHVTRSNHPMDRPIETHFRSKLIFGLLFALFVTCILALFMFTRATTDPRGMTDTDINKLPTLQPALHALRPTTTVRAEFRPSSEAPLDAISTGLIMALNVGNGDIVAKGDTILTIGNLDIELDILAREGQIEEQLTLLDGQQIDIQKSLLNLQSNIQRLEYDVIEALDEVEQNQTLLTKDIIAPEALKRSKRKLEQVRRQLATAQEGFELEKRREATLVQRQADVLRRSQQQASRLEEQRESLIMKAGQAGVVTGLDSLVGERVQQGQRLAVIIGDDAYNLEANINEFFLDRLQIGTPANVRLDNESYPATLISIDPDVSDGKVAVEFEMKTAAVGASARAGRSAVVDVELEATDRVLTLPVSVMEIAQNAGGTLLVRIGDKYESRSIIFGPRDGDRVEIVSGLTAEDQVVLKSSDTTKRG